MLVQTDERGWALARPYIDKAMKHSPIPRTTDEVLAAVKAGRLKLFLILEKDKVAGCAVLQILHDLDTPIMNAYLVSHDDGYAGEDGDFAQVEDMCRAMGIKYMCYYGRRGFLRKHGPKGWKVAQTVMVKEV